jgi:hypothetical protein
MCPPKTSLALKSKFLAALDRSNEAPTNKSLATAARARSPASPAIWTTRFRSKRRPPQSVLMARATVARNLVPSATLAAVGNVGKTSNKWPMHRIRARQISTIARRLWPAAGVPTVAAEWRKGAKASDYFFRPIVRNLRKNRAKSRNRSRSEEGIPSGSKCITSFLILRTASNLLARLSSCAAEQTADIRARRSQPQDGSNSFWPRLSSGWPIVSPTTSLLKQSSSFQAAKVAFNFCGRWDFKLNDCRLTITPVSRDRLPSRADWTTIPGVYLKARSSLFPARARDRKFRDRATPSARRAGSSSRAPSVA